MPLHPRREPDKVRGSKKLARRPITHGGKGAYPRKLAEALKLLQQFKGEGGHRKSNNNNNNDDGIQAGLAFAQQGLPQAPVSEIDCFGCGQKGHKLFACEETSQAKKN